MTGAAQGRERADVIRFRHPVTGEERVGLFVRDVPEHRALVVEVPTHGEVVVHRDHVVAKGDR